MLVILRRERPNDGAKVTNDVRIMKNVTPTDEFKVFSVTGLRAAHHSRG